jgi:hypothetical protein
VVVAALAAPTLTVTVGLAVAMAPPPMVPVIVAVPAVEVLSVAVYVPFRLSVTDESDPKVVASVTVPLVDVRLLPLASLAWTVIVDVAPAVTDAGLAAIVVVAAAAGPATTGKVFERPVLPPPVAVIVNVGVLVFVIVTD